MSDEDDYLRQAAVTAVATLEELAGKANYPAVRLAAAKQILSVVLGA